MDYERIQKPQSINGGFSPGKLRTMLMGVEKQRKKEDQLESACTLRSQAFDLDESGSNVCDKIKDVDVVSVLPDCATSTTTKNTFEPEMIKENNNQNGSIPSSGARNQNQNQNQESSPDYSDDQTGPPPPSSNFEFQRGERVHHHHNHNHNQQQQRAPFSKPVRSKWDDAQKWIASPTSNRPRSSAAPVQGRRVSRQSSTKLVLEALPDSNPSSFEEPDTKQIDVGQERVESWAQKLLPWEMDAYNPTADSYSKPVRMIENSVGESAINLSRHSSSVAVQSSMTFTPPQTTARSVSMRDMGTEMTPIASQEPSRNGTPVRATTPIRSPCSSRPSTPPRAGSELSRAVVGIGIESSEVDRGLTERELQMKTRREIMALGTQLGKTNIAAWASKEEEDKEVSTSFEAKNVIETRATAWEEAEKAKFIARFKREEMKIQAWENHQKAKTEAEMRKIEVEVERMRGEAHEKLMNKLAAARLKAEEKRAAAEAKRNQRAAKTEQQADYIRKTGRVPSFFFSWTCCF